MVLDDFRRGRLSAGQLCAKLELAERECAPAPPPAPEHSGRSRGAWRGARAPAPVLLPQETANSPAGGSSTFTPVQAQRGVGRFQHPEPGRQRADEAVVLV